MTIAWGRRQNTNGAAQAGDVRAGPKVSTFFGQFCVELRFSQRLGNELKRFARQRWDLQRFGTC
jgi:hypothetical protein